ncbi:MAG: transglycosylase SLT domain-containing protein [Rickettsiaceae bacterium]
MSIILTIFFISPVVIAGSSTEAKVFDLIKKQKWSLAYNLAKKSQNEPLIKIVLSQKFLDSSCKTNSFKKITTFLLHNPNWPQRDLIQIYAENALTKTTKQDDIIKWFTKNKPLTGKGYKYYALAASDKIKDPSKLPLIIKSGWHYGNFSLNEQKQYYNKFKKYLNQNDHIQRIDNLLLEERITMAKNSYYLISPGYQKSFDTQIELIKQGPKYANTLKHVPAKYYTPGLIYRYLQANKSKNLKSAEIVKLMTAIKADENYADQIWSMQNCIAREFIEKKKYQDAYSVISCYFTKNIAYQSDAEFLLGWLDLSFLQKPEVAIKHFRQFNRIVKTPISKSRGVYWLARAYEALGNKETATRLYHQATTDYPFTFYGQVSAIELGKQKIHLFDDIKQGKTTTTNNHTHRLNQLFLATKVILQHGSTNLSQIYLRTAIESLTSKADIIDFAKILDENATIHHMSWLAKHAAQQHVSMIQYAYPTPLYKLASSPIEKSLMYSIIKQESVFDQHAISNAEAKGFMQIIDETACSVAQDIGYKCIINKLTEDPSYNITLGSNYLNQLIDLFDQSYILAIASYNGGKHNVDKWLTIYGDPRQMKHHRDVITWLESIPYYETRNYVQRVLENLQVYRTILNPSAPLTLMHDLIHNKQSRVVK